MHGQFKRAAKSDSCTSQPTAGEFLVLPVLAAIALVALMIIQPNAGVWIAEAAQAEFVGDVPSARPSTQFAEPAAAQRSVTSDWIARVQTAWRGQR